MQYQFEKNTKVRLDACFSPLSVSCSNAQVCGFVNMILNRYDVFNRFWSYTFSMAKEKEYVKKRFENTTKISKICHDIVLKEKVEFSIMQIVDVN